ncbi:MAG: M48 family metalloprotease [Bdellovibrionales bacterium]|nr:M48 family metalloprotease [Bdellovibrionales bacterium]
MNPKKVRIAVGWFWLVILFSFGAAMAIRVYYAAGLITEYHRVGGNAFLWVLGILALLATIILPMYAKEALKRVGNQLVSYFKQMLPRLTFYRSTGLEALVELVFKMRQRKMSQQFRLRVKRMIHDIADDWEHPRPEVIFDPNNKIFAKVKGLNAGMLDLMVGTDALLVGDRLLEILNEEQLRGVMAHEMQHSNAAENKLSVLLKASSLFLFMLGTLGGLHYMFVHLFSSELSFWHGLGTWAWQFVMYIGFMHISSIFSMMMSRNIEFKTDMLSCAKEGKWQGLASALIRMHEEALRLRAEAQLPAPPKGVWAKLMRSHPSVTARVRILQWAAS